MPLNAKCEEPLTPSVKSEQQAVDDEPDEKFITVSFGRQIYAYFDDYYLQRNVLAPTGAVLKPFLYVLLKKLP